MLLTAPIAGRAPSAIQGWALAVLFLVLLYDRPRPALLLYWTTNNLISADPQPALIAVLTGQASEARVRALVQRADCST